MAETTQQPQPPEPIWTADPASPFSGPFEIWMLWFPAGDLDGKRVEGHWARAIDGKPNDLFLACVTEAEAIEAAEYQNENFFLDRECYPVRVK